MRNLHHRRIPGNTSEAASSLARIIRSAEKRGADPFTLDSLRSRLSTLSGLDGEPRATALHFDLFGGRV